MTNKITVERVLIDETLTGSVEIPVYTIESTAPGKTVYIQSSVHGAELQGNAVIYELFNYFKTAKFSGKIIFVPLANPLASGQKLGTYTFGRFNPVTGDNWNRMYLNLKDIDFDDFVSKHNSSSTQEINSAFKDLIYDSLENYISTQGKYEVSDNKRLFITLQKLASHADIVLDLHTGANATRYIYSPECQETKMKDINFPHYIVIPNEFGGAMDEATFTPWFNLTQKLKEAGVNYDYDFESYTVELGSEEIIDMLEAKNDASRILSLLEARNVLNEKIDKLDTKQFSCHLSDYKSYHSPIAGLCEYHVRPGNHFKSGDTLATIYQMDKLDQESSYREVKALTDGILIHQTPSASVKKGMELFQVFSKFKEL